MILSRRTIAVFAIGSLAVAGCGSGDQTPHPVDQPAPTIKGPISPGQIGLSERAPVDPTTPLPPPDLVDPQGIGRRGFWASTRSRTAFADWTMHQTAIDALTRIGESAVPALVKLLDEPEPQLRIDAVVALGRIGPEAHGAMPRLIALVENDPDEAVRKNAVRALGQIGPAAAAAVPVLVEQLRASADTPTGGERPVRRMPQRENLRSTQPADER